jgi:hypothetical protein
MQFTKEEVAAGYRDNTPNAARLMEAMRHITIGLKPKPMSRVHEHLKEQKDKADFLAADEAAQERAGLAYVKGATSVCPSCGVDDEEHREKIDDMVEDVIAQLTDEHDCHLDGEDGHCKHPSHEDYQPEPEQA